MIGNKLTINYTKSNFMLLTNNRTNYQLALYIDGNKIDQVKMVKYLGIRIDEKLNWSEQIKHLEGKLSSACSLIGKLRHYVDIKCLLSFYYSHVYSHLSYAILTYGMANKASLHRLQVLHRKCTRLMAQYGALSEINFRSLEIFKNMNLLTLDDICKLELGKLMHRSFHKTLPITFDTIFSLKTKMHSYNLRSNNVIMFQQPHATTAKMQNWITVQGPILWNSLPANIKEKSYKTFSKCLKEKMLNDY